MYMHSRVGARPAASGDVEACSLVLTFVVNAGLAEMAKEKKGRLSGQNRANYHYSSGQTS